MPKAVTVGEPVSMCTVFKPRPVYSAPVINAPCRAPLISLGSKTEP